MRKKVSAYVWKKWNVWKHFSHLYFLISRPILKNFPANDLFIRTTSDDLHFGHFLSDENSLSIDFFFYRKGRKNKLESKEISIFDKMAMLN